MGSLTDYFNASHTYKPVYQIGDRVFGYYQKIPFVGSVGNDRVVSESGPEVTIHLDLPIKLDTKVCNIIVVRHKDIKRLASYDEFVQNRLRK